MKAYHITEKDNLKSILTEGLIPRVGPRSADLEEQKPLVYLFNSMDDVENALLNWLGEWYEDNSDDPDDVSLVVLEINITGLKFDTEAFEIQIDEVISPDRIINIIPEDEI